MTDMQGALWIAAAAAAGLAGVAAWADRRRARRTRLDDVGWVPWPLVLLAATMAAAVCAGLALKG